MSGDIDFDINNYTDDELYQLVDLTGNATKQQIYDKTNGYIQKYVKANKPKYYNFFISVQNRLLHLLEDGSVGEESDSGGSFIETEYEPNNTRDGDLVDRRSYAKVVDSNNDHFVLRRERLKIGQGAGVPYVQGQMNPTLRNVKKQLISIDSHYRQLLQCTTTASNEVARAAGITISSLDCSGNIGACSGAAKIYYADSATDFTFNLSQPIKNVLNLHVYSYEIPHSWYVFSPDYGTSSFGVSGECIDISAGNYSPSLLIADISSALHSAKGGVANDIHISLNSKNNKVTIDSSGGNPFNLVFFDPSGQIYDCSRAHCPTSGAKLDYNLGWLLGFRQPSYSGQSTYTGESLIDTYGFRYLYIELDDFNRNRLNQSVISLDANLDTFSYPASKRCALPAADPSSNTVLKSGSCGKPSPSWQGAPLTANQTYSRAQLVNAQGRKPANRYRSPVNSDIIARIPVRKFNNYDILLDSWNNSLKGTAREYFGPVTLKRFRVRLLNDKGYVVNLNNMNFSFSLIAEHLYQY